MSSLNLNTDELKQLVANWFTKQQPIPSDVIFTISLSFDKVEVEATLPDKETMLLATILSRENFKIVTSIAGHGNSTGRNGLWNGLLNYYNERTEQSFNTVTVRRFLEDFSESKFLSTPRMGRKLLRNVNSILQHCGFPQLRKD